MLREERQEFIAREVRAVGFAHAADLADRLQVSRVTVWRDIDRLSRDGVVAKVHGGAAAPTDRQHEGVPRRAGRGELTIGMQIPTGDYYYRDVANAARKVCEAFGARLVVTASGYGGSQVDLASIKGLVDVGVDGLLLTPGPPHPRSGIGGEVLDDLHLPVVLVERDLAGLGGPDRASVTTAHEAGVYAAVDHLVGLGHRKVGLVTFAANSRLRSRIRIAFAEAVDDLGALDESGTPWEWDGGTTTADILAGVGEAGITAVVVLNDGLAVDLSHQARSLGREIPQDLSIISYDDEIAATALPPLSAISPRRTTLGELAARQLLTHLSGGAKLSGRRTQVEPVLVLRESTAPPVRTRSPRR